MTIANVEEFCRSFCEVGGLPAPVLEGDADGTIAHSVRMRGIPVTMMGFRHRPETAYVLVELGPLPEERERECWRMLADTNLMMLSQDAPSFSRNPTNGEPMLIRAMPLAAIGASDAFERVAAMVETALVWQDGFDGTEDAEDANGADFARGASA